MNILLLQWGLVSFSIGLILSLPLAAVHYKRSPIWTKIFTNARKLKGAHVDFFMQTLSCGMAYVLELGFHTAFPGWIVILLLYGTIGNPAILLFEATQLPRLRASRLLYRILKSTSPVSLLVAWFAIVFSVVSLSLLLVLAGLVLVLGLLLGYCVLHAKDHGRGRM
ncbi:hypothetical protein ACTID9_10265 [Brevibacillus fluminis]|uniref:hypothetical protein n=1 Tax=Brevibacillus fluminis TaxID=511487 RepID=UPI003F8BBFAF